MDRRARLLPLGLQRLRLLDCLGGDSLHAPGYFDPAPDADLFTAFREHVARLSREWAAETDPLVMALLAAARFLTGDLAAAAAVLDHLPVAAPQLDHNAGICLLAPLYALRTALPLPADLTDTRRWLAGSAEQTALRAWLADNRDRLRWVEVEGVYRLDRAAGQEF
ncbi:MAG: hypothetical protein U5O69_04585 [Candidatus Competibacteraceae bacterium]|nr:hypothetical protein [Candidatus Competibacteraceae bacterium]